MKSKRLLAGVLAAVLCFAILGAAGAELTLEEEMKGKRVSRRVWSDEDGNTVNGPDGYAYVTYSYSNSETTEKYYDADGQPCMTPGGYYGRIVSYDGKRRVDGITYLDETGAKTDIPAGYARVRMVYRTWGALKELTYYDAMGRKVVVPSLGYAGIRCEHRGTTLTGRTYVNADEVPVDGPEGWAVMTQSVTKTNKVRGISYTHADGSPATCAEGWSSCEKDLDEKGRATETRYLDRDNKLTNSLIGYARETVNYSGNRSCIVRRYDADGQPVPMGEGYVFIRKTLDSDSRVLTESWLDSSSEPTLNSDGVAGNAYTYGKNGEVVKVSFFDRDGVTCENLHGYAGYENVLNEDGTLARRIYTGADGRPADTDAGYCEVEYTYNEFGQIESETYYDTKGTRVSIR